MKYFILFSIVSGLMGSSSFADSNCVDCRCQAWYIAHIHSCDQATGLASGGKMDPGNQGNPPPQHKGP